ncbi:MarR family transcriptional regulator [Rhodococcus rhodnii]|nr:MarR family transcriptional regulator [Rhodococcus rhodnii]TXG89126.1 MarR family transcriptional regulator [Rhodococcus rhodnii]
MTRAESLDTGRTTDIPGDIPPAVSAEVSAFRDDVTTFFRRLRSERRDHKLTPTQLQALGHLERHGPMTAIALARREQVTPQSIARTIAHLEGEGMLTRGPDPDDARASLISLTDAGRERVRDDRVLRSRWLADLLERECTPHEREVLFLAGRIMRGLGGDPDPGERGARQ